MKKKAKKPMKKTKKKSGFKPHMMYKGTMKKFAFSLEEHNKLMKKGYKNTKPKKK